MMQAMDCELSLLPKKLLEYSSVVLPKASESLGRKVSLELIMQPWFYMQI